MSRQRILVAANQETLKVLRDALSGLNLVEVTNFQAAQYQIMEDGFALFVIGVHFDQSRSVELVNYIRETPEHRDSPIVLVRLLPAALKDILNTTLSALVRVGTVTRYVESDSSGNFAARLKDTVISLLPEELAIQAE